MPLDPRDRYAVKPGSGPVQKAGSPNLLSVTGTPIARLTEVSRLLWKVPPGNFT